MLQSETPAHAACTASWALQSLWASAASAVIRSGHSLDRRSTYGDGALRSIRRRLSLAASCSGRLLRERGARLPMLAGWDRGAARRRRRAGTQKEMITGVASRKKKIIPLCLTIPLCWSPIPTPKARCTGDDETYYPADPGSAPYVAGRWLPPSAVAAHLGCRRGPHDCGWRPS